VDISCPKIANLRRKKYFPYFCNSLQFQRTYFTERRWLIVCNLEKTESKTRISHFGDPMKTFPNLLSAIAVSVLLSLAAPFAWAQSREVRKSAALNGGGDLKVASDRGSVRLSGWDQNQVEVVAVISRPEGDRDFDPRSIELTQIEVLGSGDSVTVRANYDAIPERDGMRGGRSIPVVDFEIRAPRRLSLRLSTDRGKADVRNLEGRLEITSDRGGVTAQDLSGDIRLRMDRGTATMSGLRGSLDVRTDRGDAKLRADQISGDSVFESDRGTIELSIPSSQGLNVIASRGRRMGFQSDFAITSSTFSEDRVEGSINGGGPKLSIRSDRGQTRLRQLQ
jgi:hypothetical protein